MYLVEHDTMIFIMGYKILLLGSFIFAFKLMPEEESELKKWLSGMWAIWYCHELYPDHDELLYDSLDALCKYSEDWSNSDNPLHCK